MPPRLLLLAAALLPAAAASPSAPPAVLCSDGGCDADGSVNLLQTASAQQAPKESLAADVRGKRRAAAQVSTQGQKLESNATQAGAEAQKQASNATQPPVRNAPEVELLQMNLTFANLFSQQIDIELDYSDASSIPTKNKVLLAIIELFGLGLCGIDRCYMGQTALGIVKGVTLGGLTVWAFLDYLVVIITCLSMNPELNGMGMRAHFEKHSVMPAFIIVLVLIILKLLCGHHHARKRSPSSSSKEPMVEKEANTAAAPVFTG